MDVELLIAASTVVVPRKWINSYALIPPVAPHIAAKRSGVEIDIAIILQACRELQNVAEIVIVRGIGGFLVPLNGIVMAVICAGSGFSGNTGGGCARLPKPCATDRPAVRATGCSSQAGLQIRLTRR